MKRVNKYIIISLIILGACQSEKGEQAVEQIDPAAAKVENIVFEKISKHLITDVVECTGRIDVPPNQRAAVYAPIGAVVSNITVLPGDKVTKGKNLFTLRHQDLIKIQESYITAKNNFELLKINLQRKEKLAESNSVSEKDLRMAQHDYNVAKANYESLHSQLKLIGVSDKQLAKNGISSSVVFRAPIDGYISHIDVVSGSYVDIKTVIMTIINTDHKHVELEIYADKINNVRIGQQVGLHTAGSEIEYQAEIHLVGKEVNEDTRTVSVHAHLDDNSADNLIIGTYLYAGVMISSDSVYSLQNSAIVKIQGENFVLIKDGEDLKPVVVKLGKSFKEYIEIKNFEELLSEEIVSKNAYYLIETE